MKEKNYQFDIVKYIEEFFNTLKNEEYDKTKIYIDIIDITNKLGIHNIEAKLLYEALENMVQNKKIVQQKSQQQEKDTKKIVPIKEINQDEKKIVFTDCQKSIFKEYILSKRRKVKKLTGAILLKPMSKEKTDILLDIIQEYDDIIANVVNTGNKKQIILRNYKNQEISINETKEEAKQAYLNHDYYKCIEKNLILLENTKYPNISVYVSLGLSYAKLFKKKAAIRYLQIANSIAKDKKIDRDFTNLIERLQGKTKDEDFKPYFVMNEDEFSYDNIDNYYGIDDFEEVNEYIQEIEFDVETSCHRIGRTEEEIDIIKLIYAREFFKLGQYAKGEEFLKSYEHSKNKTEKTKNIYENLKKNKKLYQYLKHDEPKKLVLTVTPSKKD